MGREEVTAVRRKMMPKLTALAASEHFKRARRQEKHNDPHVRSLTASEFFKHTLSCRLGMEEIEPHGRMSTSGPSINI